MLKVWLVDNDKSRRLYLGEYKSNDEASAQIAAKKRYPKLFDKLVANSFHFQFEREKGPYRKKNKPK